MPQTVRRTGSSFALKAKILFVEDGFEKLALPLRKNKDQRRAGELHITDEEVTEIEAFFAKSAA